MHALYLLIPFIGICVIAYRYYSAFLAAKVLVLNDARVTPAHERYDGQNYYPVSRWVLFGSHFSAIAGAGPLIGPVLAAQFGYAPGIPRGWRRIRSRRSTSSARWPPRTSTCRPAGSRARIPSSPSEPPAGSTLPKSSTA